MFLKQTRKRVESEQGFEDCFLACDIIVHNVRSSQYKICYSSCVSGVFLQNTLSLQPQFLKERHVVVLFNKILV